MLLSHLRRPIFHISSAWSTPFMIQELVQWTGLRWSSIHSAFSVKNIPDRSKALVEVLRLAASSQTQVTRRNATDMWLQGSLVFRRIPRHPRKMWPTCNKYALNNFFMMLPVKIYWMAFNPLPPPSERQSSWKIRETKMPEDLSAPVVHSQSCKIHWQPVTKLYFQKLNEVVVLDLLKI